MVFQIGRTKKLFIDRVSENAYESPKYLFNMFQSKTFLTIVDKQILTDPTTLLMKS